ncbi:MAG: DUF4386 family protein [Gemmatimonadales bacterium]
MTDPHPISSRAAGSPVATARAAGAFWAVVFLLGTVSLFIQPGPLQTAAIRASGLCYIVVTLLLYQLLRPVSQPIALVAALLGLTGCAISLFGLSRVLAVRDLVFFGGQCVLVGYLIVRSTFLPRILGGLLIFGGLGWLTFAVPTLARPLYPFNYGPGMLGEGALLVWLIVKGVDLPRWLAVAAGDRRSA